MDRYSNLYPIFKELCLKFEEDFKKETGIPIYLFCGYRSFEDQLKLWKIGRRGVDGERKVTNSLPGQSFHNYGLAADYVFDADLLKPQVQWSWDSKFPWDKIGIVSKRLGINWGGNFKSVDKPHIEKTWGLTYQQCNIIYNTVGIVGLWKDIDNLRNPPNVTTVIIKDTVKDINQPINNTESNKIDKETQIQPKTSLISRLFGIISNILKG